MKNQRKTIAFVLGLATVLVAHPLLAQPTQAPDPDQKAIAAHLLGAGAKERSDALSAAMGIEPAKIGSELRAALITLLERVGQERRAREVAYRRNQPLTRSEIGGEFGGGVASVVARLHDPLAIPALAGSLGTGFTVINALAGFGEAAAPAVVAIAGSPESGTSVVNDAMTTLALMVDSVPTRPLAASTLAAIERVAHQRLTTKQRSITITWLAIDLGCRFQNPALWGVIDAIATNPAEAIARGASDAGLVEQTRKRATAALTRRHSKPAPA